MLYCGLYLLIKFDSSRNASLSLSVTTNSMSAILETRRAVLYPCARPKYERTRLRRFLALPM